MYEEIKAAMLDKVKFFMLYLCISTRALRVLIMG